MTDWQRLENEYQAIAEDESNVHWRLGDRLVKDVAAGHKLNALAEMCEPIFGVGRTTIRNHHRTSVIFHDETVRAKELNWSVHQQAGTACRVDRSADYHLAYAWLDKAAEGKLTHDGLKDAMAAAKGQVHMCEPIYLLKRAPCRLTGVMEYADECMITLYIPAELARQVYAADGLLITLFMPGELVETPEQIGAKAA